MKTSAAAARILPNSGRRWILGGLVVLSGACGTAWYVHREREEQELSERALKDIPTDEYESWMQSLGYTD